MKMGQDKVNDDLVVDLDEALSQYLSDESRSTGWAESISFPKTEDEVRAVLAYVRRAGLALTIQGARTGITGGAVPQQGHVLNLSKMNRITGLEYDEQNDSFALRVQPGVLLTQVQKALQEKEFDTDDWSDASLDALEKFRHHRKWYFSSDITETSASLGGMTACNASGARSYSQGPMRDHVLELRAILADGSTLILKRGKQKANDRSFRLRTEESREISGRLPDYKMPAVKNTAGYYIRENMDLIDLFIGSEGTLGIITEIKIALSLKPASTWGVMIFFPSEVSALEFVWQVRAEEQADRPIAIEFFNHGALELFQQQQENNKSFQDIQRLPPDFHTAIYVEYHGDSREELQTRILRTGDLVSASGGSEENTWVALNPNDLEKLIQLRHAIPESVNLLIARRKKEEPAITKLGTDMAVPDDKLEWVMELYNRSLEEAGLESVIFGHIGANNLHVNILPNDKEEYQKGKALYLDWAHQIVGVGGTVSSEHGIGKIKTPMLLEMYGEAGVAEMKKVKKLFDPGGILGSGNLFSM